MSDNFWQYFGLARSPFGKDLCKSELFTYQQLNELDEILRLTIQDRSFSLVTGRAGTGKTTATRTTLEDLPRTQYRVIYLGQDKKSNSLFARLADELGMRPELTRAYRSLHISRRLENEVIAGGKDIVLIVDEAHLIERAALEELRMLTNSEMDRKSLASVILLGQIWIRDRLKYREYEALNQRIRLRYALEGLSEQETGQYIQHHLKLAGCTKELFTIDAIKQIFIASGGILRVINNICFACLLKAKTLGLKIVSAPLVKRVVQEQEVL